MRNKDYKLSKLRWELRELRMQGYKIKRLKLSQEWKKQLERYYRIEPVLYIVKTRTFNKTIRESNKLLNKIHYAKMNGKNTIKMSLGQLEHRILNRYQVTHYAIEYNVYLQS